jgi:hypothetical protein
MPSVVLKDIAQKVSSRRWWFMAALKEKHSYDKHARALGVYSVYEYFL